MILPLDFNQELLHLRGKMKNSLPLTFSDLIVQLSVFVCCFDTSTTSMVRHCSAKSLSICCCSLEEVIYLVFE
jgi:hypothetical protein